MFRDFVEYTRRFFVGIVEVKNVYGIYIRVVDSFFSIDGEIGYIIGG